MKGTVLKILPMKMSRTESVYSRITFTMDNGDWAKTDIVHTYRNYARWKPVIDAGPGTVVDNLKMRSKSEVDGDSFPKITAKFAEKTKKEIKQIPEQTSLF
jgi:hypothetical protein